MANRVRVRAAVAAAVLATGLGIGAGPWAGADQTPAGAVVGAVVQEPASARRREATVRMPAGTYVKQFDVNPFGSGRISWTYEDDRVTGAIEVDVAMVGGQCELATDAEVAMSSNGTIFGVLNGVRVTRLQVNPALLGELPVKIGPDAYPLVEPLVNDVVVDLPFSYHARIQGDRLTISQFRTLLAGPNPLGKLGAVVGDGDLQVLGMFQALSAAVEGTYTLADGKEPPRRPEPPRKGAPRK